MMVVYRPQLVTTFEQGKEVSCVQMKDVCFCAGGTGLGLRGMMVFVLTVLISP